MLSAVLTLIYISLMATGVFAAEPQNITTTTFTIVRAGSTEYKEIKGGIDAAVAALKKGDGASLISCISKEYLDSGWKKDEVRKRYSLVLESYREIEAIVQVLNVEVSGNYARVRSEGVLLGKPRKIAIGEADESIVIDSWKLGLHKLIKEDGTWKIHGDQLPIESGRVRHLLF